MNLLLDEVKDITECPICTDMFYNPKILPCHHTFCLKCIEQYGKDKRPGKALPCPMCRREFKVPTGGFSELSTNFFMDKLITTILTSEADCDICTQIGKNDKKIASSLCTTCRGNLGDECRKISKSMKISMDRKLTPVGEVSEAARAKLEANFCSRHPSKEFEFYCQVCKVLICVTCFMASHRHHELCGIDDAALTFRKVFRSYSDDMSVFMMNIEERSERVNEQVESFTRFCEQIEKNVIERCNEIKQANPQAIKRVDRQTSDLVKKLNSHKTLELENIESDREELRMNLVICDSFKQFCRKVVTEADSIEVVSLADELKTRAGELKSLPLPELRTLPQIKFVPSDFDRKTNLDNIVGKLTCKLSLSKFVTSNVCWQSKL